MNTGQVEAQGMDGIAVEISNQAIELNDLIAQVEAYFYGPTPAATKECGGPDQKPAGPQGLIQRLSGARNINYDTTERLKAIMSSIGI